MPTIREIAAATGISSTGSVSAAVRALEDGGFISRTAGSARSIRLRGRKTAPAGITKVPVLPLPAGREDFWEGNPVSFLKLDKQIFHGRSLAAVSVPHSSDLMSLKAARIFLILEKNRPRPGEVFAFLVNGTLTAGPVYGSGKWWRFYDLFSGDEVIISREDSNRMIIGRVAALISAFVRSGPRERR